MLFVWFHALRQILEVGGLDCLLELAVRDLALNLELCVFAYLGFAFKWHISSLKNCPGFVHL